MRIPWPNGYGASPDTIRMLQSFDNGDSNGDSSGIDGMNYMDEMLPTLYVIGRDGRVAWHDNRARLRHQPIPKLLSDLEDAIEKALGTVL